MTDHYAYQCKCGSRFETTNYQAVINFMSYHLCREGKNNDQID